MTERTDEIAGKGWLRRVVGSAGPLARLALVTAMPLAVVGCTGDPFGARSDATRSVTLPAAAPRVTGVDTAAQREHRRLIATLGGEYRWPPAQTLLADVLERLSQASGSTGDKYRLTILNSPAVNAFALPTGNIYITRGLLALANDTSEIAAVLAHEIAHVSARHAIERAELEKTTGLINRVNESFSSDTAARLRRDQTRLAFASFSRQQELEADTISVRVIGQAGFDPYGAPRFLTSLGRSVASRATMLGQRAGAETPDITATHPSTPERIQQATLAARQIAAPGVGEGDRNRFLAAISGLTLGDDPSEGVVRGRSFIHPRLAVSFVAPEGFVLENTQTAVLGLGAGGQQALRFDSIKTPDSASVEAYLSSGLIEGSSTTDVEALTVDGLPAATGLARSDEWTFRLFAVRNGMQTYRMILAARQFTPEIDQSFREAVASFRRLKPQEASAVRPIRIAIVTAEPGETVETLAEKMAYPDRREERFRVLNGLDPEQTLKPGSRYKLATE